jgi:glycosyltransferase involved in cell wall biosynthesis
MKRGNTWIKKASALREKAYNMSSNRPLVSVVTPSYNQGRFIEDTLLSVKNQDYPNVEHIVVDGGSTDNTLEILRKHEDKYSLTWISEPDNGQSDAINKGFTRSKGEIIGWLNSDDVYFDKEVISYIVGQFESSRDVDVIHGSNVPMTEDNLVFKVRPSFPWVSYKRLLRRDCVIQSATFFRRSIIQSNQLDVNLDFVMDYEYWLRIAKAGARFKSVSRVLSANRVHLARKSKVAKEQMKAEKRKVQARYGQKFDLGYQLQRYSPFLPWTFLSRILGLRIIMQIYANFERQDLAFCGKLDSRQKIVFKCLLPFL